MRVSVVVSALALTATVAAFPIALDMRGFEEVLDDLGIDIAIESFFHHTVGRKRDVRPLEIVDSDGHVIVALEPLLNVDLEGVDTIRKVKRGDTAGIMDVKSNDEVSVDALVDLSPLLKVDADVDLHIHRRDDTIDLEATVDLSDILLGSVDLSHLDLSSLDLSHLDLGEGDLSALLVRLNGLLHHTDTQTESPATTETPPVLAN